jgi:cell division septum initiation protein DivIVA
VGSRNYDQPTVEGKPSVRGRARQEDRPAGEEPQTGLDSPGFEGENEPQTKFLLGRLATQIDGLQHQLAAFIARRDEAVAERASQHVASIVGAAERSAAQITAGAEEDAARIRERLLADVQAEAEAIRSEARADAARIRSDARVQAARAREEAVIEASAEIQMVCARLSEELQAGARQSIAVVDSPPAAAKRITNEVDEAVVELRGAAALLEQSLHNVRTIGE